LWSRVTKKAKNSQKLTETPQNRWGAPIGPFSALGNPGFVFRVILPAFLERYLARNAFSNAFFGRKN
jgi:hypothetical protein